jgi:hypothetical protein
MRLVSHENIIASLEKGKMQYIVKLASLAIFKLVFILANLATNFLFARLVRNKSHYKICLRDSREASLALKFLSARLVRSESRYEICLRDS